MLVFAEKQLEDRLTLGDYKIQDNSLLHLVERLRTIPVQLFIKTLTGKRISVEVEGSEMIKNVKAKIQIQEDISGKQQTLILAGKQLKDHALTEYNISSNIQHVQESIIYLLLKEGEEVDLDSFQK